MNRPHNTRFPVGNARTFLKVALLPDIKLYFMILSTAVYTDLVKSKISTLFTLIKQADRWVKNLLLTKSQSESS